MALAISTTSALRGTSDLRRLVEAVVAAGEHDEADWVEWKGPLDLTTKAGCVAVARATLGMANRDPERAQVSCEGLGYVLVGTEPGALRGLPSIDPATLDQQVEPYLGGAAGPAWAPSYVTVDGKTVLVITVEAPRPGDGIFTLRREFDKHKSGAIFVRKHGRTVLADAADVDRLQRRLTAVTPTRRAALNVAVSGDVPLSWFASGSVSSTIEKWATARQRQLLDKAREVERIRQGDVGPQGEVFGAAGFSFALAAAKAQQDSLLHQAARGLTGWGVAEEDTRSLTEYEQDVEAWRADLVEAAHAGLPGRYTRAGHGLITVEVRNPGSRYLPRVQIEVVFDYGNVKGLELHPEWVSYPLRPREFGKPQPPASFTSLGAMSQYVPVMPGFPAPDFHRRTWVEDGSVIIKWDIGDLRQHARDISDEVYVLLASRPPDGFLHGTWKATVPDIDGVLTGTVDVPVAESPVNIPNVLDIKRPRG